MKVCKPHRNNQSPKFGINYYYRTFKYVRRNAEGENLIPPWIGKQDGYGQFPTTFVEAYGEDHEPASIQQIRVFIIQTPQGNTEAKGGHIRHGKIAIPY